MPESGRSRFHVVKGGIDDARGAGDMPSISTGQLGMIIFLVSLGVLFTGTMVAYLIVRFQNDAWRTSEQPGLPAGLIASTVLIVGASFTLHRATAAIRKNDARGLTRMLIATLVLGLAFLAGQTWNWLTLAQHDLPPNAKSLYAFTFYMLTGVHALHVIGGFVPLALCLRTSVQNGYSSLNYRGVKYCAQYWHFLDVVWILMLGIMWAVT